ncbi:hypothetical protein PV10_01126 [Exophiala mesophila]|uniref:Pre-mRNA-splicing factor 18 n=1 Tax=Exophiala mesophila TaxID=212818 RepID=A0A0D1Y9M5_EXOME|nr:uncharacterized protein PV10_01126 [Exophiala mesophila]KIV97366.1 hypothetical protein PV10_01126 [Exophiala mesophila]
MDFKSLMSKHISKSKPNPSKSAPESSVSPSTSTSTTTSKYQRRAEAEAAREAAYAREQAQIEAERQERAAKKRKLEEEEAEQAALRAEKKRRLAEESKQRREEEERQEERKRRKRLGLPDLPDPSSTENNANGHNDSNSSQQSIPDGEDIDDETLRSKLRNLDQPATLFSEDHTGRLLRYRALTRQAVAAAPKLSSGPIPTTLEPVPEKDILIPNPLPAQDSPEHEYLYRQLASYFTLVLREWSTALSQRDASVQSSSGGKAALAAYRQVVADLTPLFRHFEKHTLPPDLMDPICSIVRAAQHRRYVEANDGYLTLSIGKAAWPIGVTMVGIHERSAREKLHESGSGKQAHIMTDEVTRKFLQSIKRCLSFAQTRWPPEDLGQLMG